MPAKLIDETNNVYGQLTVLRPIRRAQDKKTKWECQCSCGNIIICSGSELRKGQRTSCGQRCNNIKNEIGKDYGFLTVLKKDNTKPQEFADHCVHWICKCNLCGSIKSISGKSLRNGDTKSCGCIKSAGENLIKSVLKEFNYNFIQEYTFQDLISPFSKSKLRFDFAIFDNNNLLFLIEYQGQQHEQEVPYFKHSLAYTKTCDETKRQYCMQKDIPLVYFTSLYKGKLPNKEEIKLQIQETWRELKNEISD